MADPQIEKLLVVQDRDVKLQKVELELTRIPKERAALESKIKAEEENIELARQNLKAKEVARNDLDNQVKSQESAIQKYRTMQLEVKKNEEYKALTQQIEQAEASISELEDSEIKLMIEIDGEQVAYDAAKAEIEERIKTQKLLIEQLDGRELTIKANIDASREALSNARSDADGTYLDHYDRVRKLSKRPPYVTQIKNHQCEGCHLRVSNEVARAVHDANEPHFCDQCGRIVFL